jgi:hypothetical protein
MILHELQGKETARHKGGREGKKELTGGESPDELTRTKTEQTEGDKLLQDKIPK